ncbi:sigma-70 family RNA polymerase sigma factor [Ruminococcaceae bacterium OttesenSCG-928-A16]|nr:sigma-70 family RNA polymerase sigma factor [Ruminococcaceae bacterium OttesenSCG-928-A16]
MKNKKEKHVVSLIKKAVKGNKEAFGALYELKAREVIYLCLREMGNIEDGKDAAQEVFIRMHQGITSLRSPQAFNVWLNRVILSTCNDMRRKNMRQPMNAYDDALEKEIIVDFTSAMPADFVEKEENRKLIVELVDALPPKYRRCVWLHYYQKLTYAEIAQVLDIPQDAVNNNLRMARQYLKAEIEKRYGDYHNLAAVPAVAMGPALVEVFKSSAAAEVPKALLQECLAKASLGAGLPVAKAAMGTATKVLVGLLTVVFTGTVAFAAYAVPWQTLFAPQTSNTQSQITAQSQMAQSSPALPTTLAGQVNLPTQADGTPAKLAQDAQIVLLAPNQQQVATAPLLANGSFMFTNLNLPQTGAYTLRVVQNQQGSGVMVDDLIITLTEDGTWQL